MKPVLLTIGHSTHTWQAFVDLLKTWGVEQLVDIRSVPQSKTFPWFARHKMEVSLPKAGIDYVYLAKLGGFREPSKDSVNLGWENVRFRAYADYMQTEPFLEGLNELRQLMAKRQTCVMCAESVWWRCHRRMVADALTVRGVVVKHIMGDKIVKLHELTKFAVVKKKSDQEISLTYPLELFASLA